MSPWMRALLLQDYNTRVVLLGTIFLGMSSGMVGTLMLLRRRALVGDVASHAALPGVGFAYLIMERIHPGSGKWFPGLLTGAAISAGLGLLCSRGFARIRRIREDAALAITLSLFFGCGVVLFTMIQGLPSGQSAGLNEFVFGKAAALLQADVQLLAVASLIVLVTCVALEKEFALLCFDEDFASVNGYPVARLDLLLTLLVIGVTVLGMQSVGLLLVVAMLVIPAAAASYWSERLRTRQFLSMLIGGASAGLGVLISAAVPKFAAGAVIVLAGTALFVISLLFGRTGGIVWRLREQWNFRQQIGLEDLLRTCFEVLESRGPATGPSDWLSELPISKAELEAARDWVSGRLPYLLHVACYQGLLRYDAQGNLRLTSSGRRRAILAVRTHRLWERYLIEHAAETPETVDRRADRTEHLLRADAVEELEALLPQIERPMPVPTSPHETAASESSLLPRPLLKAEDQHAQ
ncbi:iron chelate uptake ABC transporter family permease subunit [bacterium]|nr:iron chelate uptake ABC transporter family permease subunit [bacterium]